MKPFNTSINKEKFKAKVKKALLLKKVSREIAFLGMN